MVLAMRRHILYLKFVAEGGAEAACMARFGMAPRCNNMIHVSIVELDLEAIRDEELLVSNGGLRVELLVLLDSEDAVLGRIELGLLGSPRRHLVGIALAPIMVRREQCCIYGWSIGTFLHWNLQRAVLL